jgi:hypothetical protein
MDFKLAIAAAVSDLANLHKGGEEFKREIQVLIAEERKKRNPDFTTNIQTKGDKDVR